MRFTDIAVAVGLDARCLEADMTNPKWQAIIEKNRALATGLQVWGLACVLTYVLRFLLSALFPPNTLIDLFFVGL